MAKHLKSFRRAQLVTPKKFHRSNGTNYGSTGRLFLAIVVSYFFFSKLALASTGCSTWGGLARQISYQSVASGAVSDFAAGDIISIVFNNGNPDNIVKITALRSGIKRNISV